MRAIGIAICDVVLVALGVTIAALLLAPLAVDYERTQCRRTFETVAQYPVLTDVCKDRRARRAIIMWDEINRVVRSVKE